jgi:quaternary ammonium compound-resistance protein SugE
VQGLGAEAGLIDAIGRGARVSPWVLLFLAGLAEVGWAIGLKYTEGFTRLVPTMLTLAAMAVSVVLLGLAARELPIGTAYAVWTGIGAAGTALLGMYLFAEPRDALRLACIALIVGGVLGLKATSGA